jgi:hypothetical protein
MYICYYRYKIVQLNKLPEQIINPLLKPSLLSSAIPLFAGMVFCNLCSRKIADAPSRTAAVQKNNKDQMISGRSRLVVSVAID